MRSSDDNDKSMPAIKPWVPWLTITATIAIVALCAAIIWYRYLITPATDCTISVAGDKTLDGSTVKVIPKVAADPDRSRLTMKLDEQNQYSARFFVSSGTYQVLVVRPDGLRVVDITEFVPPDRQWSYDIGRQRAGVPQTSTTKPSLEH